MNVWATKITLIAENKTIETRVIYYLTGVLQGDCLRYYCLYFVSTHSCFCWRTYLVKKLENLEKEV